MPRGRVEALLSHEVGVHLFTYFTGDAQGLRLFRSGLAGYDGLQEGLAVFERPLDGPGDFLADDRSHAGAHEAEVGHGEAKRG